jgi:outer membrane protein OmpA-like peptidoglycan-associated protein
MRFNSHVFAGTALGLLMAASPALAGGIQAGADRATARTPIVLAQADSDDQDQKLKKKERRAERRAEKGNQEGGAEQGGQQSQEQQQPKRQRPNKAERQQSGDTGGQEQKNARQAPADDEAPATKPNRKHRQADEGQAAQGGGDDNQPKRKLRQQDEQPAAGRQTSEKAQGEEPDQGRKHRKNEKKAGGGEDNSGDQAEGKKTEQPKAAESQAKPKVEEQGGKARTGEADRDKRHGKNAKNANGEDNDNGQAAKGKTDSGEAATKAEEPENAGNKEKNRAERADRNRKNGENGDNNRKNAEDDNRKNAEGDNRRNAEGKQLGGDNGQTAEGGGNVVLPKSLNGQRAGEGRKRERRNADGQNGSAENGALPDSARGRHGQRQEAGRGGKAGPLPDSDAAAQADFRRPERIESITSIEGKRRDKPERVYREHPNDVKVVKKIDNRTIVEVDNQIFVRGSDRPRLSRHARDVYYEDLPRNRTREVIERSDGSRVVTIRNEYGDVIRRSRIMPDNREVVLVYVDDRDLDRDRNRGWGDAGADLPPLVVDVPQDDYILDAGDVRDPDRYYDFLEQPPVEPVKRLYSLGEVKRSARIRDIMPRIDLDTITFDFGSAEVGQDQAGKLQSVADAISKILGDNPAETFLIEGHTDAVGSDQANLVLSDERADSVASLLTSMFEIPSENLTTQGYGEEYLKVDTEEANRQNRRVTIRRITPLVAPVASAQ